MMRRLAVGAGVALLTLVATGCYEYPHSARSVRYCADYGWGSDYCSISLCYDYMLHTGQYCPAEIRYGDGPR